MFVRGTITPDGPGTLRVAWSGPIDDHPGSPGLTIDAWGPGADWLAGRVPAMVGFDDPVRQNSNRRPTR